MSYTKKLFASLLTIALLWQLLPINASSAAVPSDASGSVYADAISYVLESGIMSLNDKGLFEPDAAVDRASVFQAFYVLSDAPSTSGESFADVSPNDWFSQTAAWAKQSGMSMGSDIGFEGSRAITRLEAAVVFYNYMRLAGIVPPVRSFDATSIPAWGKQAANNIIGVGILSDGVQSGIYSNFSRGEFAHYLHALSEKSFLTVSVLELDKYGNATLDLISQDLFDAGYDVGDMLTVTLGGKSLDAPLCTSYSDVSAGSVLVRSPDGVPSHSVNIAINMGSFAKDFGVEAGDTIGLAISTKSGYLAEWELRQLKRTNDRADYDSDAIFANFRAVNTRSIASGVLYRSSSPVNNEFGRAAFAGALSESAGIATVINLGDSVEELFGYLDESGSLFYKKLFDRGDVACINMSMDLSSQDTDAKLKEAIEFMLRHSGPYLIHCTEGKDRTGFVVAVLEALMGASVNEIEADYMTSFTNFFKVEPFSEQYHRIAESNILESLRGISGIPKGGDLTGVDLAQAAETYLKDIGLTAQQLDLLRIKLSTPIV